MPTELQEILPFSFEECQRLGRRGGDALLEALEAEGYGEFLNLQGVGWFEERDIDALHLGGWGFIEIKTDFHYDSPNIFLEAEVGGKPGCIFRTRADTLVYWFPPDRVCVFPVPALQKWFAENLLLLRAQGKERTVKSYDEQGRKWTAKGLIPRRSRVISEVPGAREIKLKHKVRVRK